MQKALVGGCQFLVCIRCNNNLKKLQTEFVKKLAHAGRINIEDSKTPLRLEKGRPRNGSDPLLLISIAGEIRSSIHDSRSSRRRRLFEYFLH